MCDFPGLSLPLAASPLGSKGGQEIRVPSLSNSPPTCAQVQRGLGRAICASGCAFGQIYLYYMCV